VGGARVSLPAPETVDLLISGGTLVDGSGSAPRPGTVAVLGGRLHIGAADWVPAAARTIEAAGLTVAPGFIDLHSHGGYTYEHGPQPLPPAANRPGWGHIAFVVDDVAAGRQAVLAAGGSAVGDVVTLETADGRSVTWCYVTDPEGNIVELQAWAARA